MTFRERWRAPYGYREVLRVGLPLVASMGSITLMQFTDRVFLGHYSLEAIAAVMPAGIACFQFIAFFMGVAGYVNVFVAQYSGAGRHHRVGAALWQGLWFCLGAWLIMIILAHVALPMFSLFDHPASVQAMEEDYFRISMLGAGLAVTETSLAAFYTGRGLTRVVMFVNLIGAALNIPLDYCLIFGIGPFPEMGIRGAAVATVSAWGIIAMLYLVLIFRRTNEERFRVRSAFRFDPALFRRLMRFGLPGGVQFFLDIFAITFFSLTVGSIGKIEMATTNMVFSIDTLAFLPMVGLSVAVSTLVGQAMGTRDVDSALFATGSAVRVALIYMGCWAFIFLTFPESLLLLFQSRSTTPAEFEPILDMGVSFLRIVAAFSLVDAVVMMVYGALKGAGDSFFLMISLGLLALFGFVLPTHLLVRVYGAGAFTAWSLLFGYICMLCVVLLFRLRSNAWRNIEVIEPEDRQGSSF